jgi:hypothetical protein
MVVRLSKLPLILALVSSLRLHWALLQSVAWVGMLVSYSQTGNFRDALGKTFDGEHPCSLGKQVDYGRKSEKKSALKLEGKQLECVDGRQVFAFSSPTAFTLLPLSDDRAPAFPIAPPLPPPRLV